MYDQTPRRIDIIKETKKTESSNLADNDTGLSWNLEHTSYNASKWTLRTTTLFHGGSNLKLLLFFFKGDRGLHQVFPIIVPKV